MGVLRRIGQVFNRRWHEHQQLFKASVLVIDDDPDIALLVSRTLELLGCVVYVATGKQALNEANIRIGSIDFDLIFLDMRLANGNGMEIYKYVKSHCRNAHVVIITGFPQELVGVYGYVGYLPKPFEQYHFEEILRKHRMPRR